MYTRRVTSHFYFRIKRKDNTKKQGRKQFFAENLFLAFKYLCLNIFNLATVNINFKKDKYTEFYILEKCFYETAYYKEKLFIK